MLLLAAALYAAGTMRLWRRGAVGRGVRRTQAACFAAGWLTLALSLVSPLHALGGALFSAHMAQHELLIAVAAPLLVLGQPVVPSLWALPVGWRRSVGRLAARPGVRRAWRAVSRPAAATALHGVALWGWHLPLLYSASLRSEAVHAAQHASFLTTALLFWWAVVEPHARRRSAGWGVLCLFLTTLHTGVLGPLISVSSRLWYPAYGATTAPFGLMPLEDQQLAGVLMWVPASVAYVGAALWLFTCWLRESGRRAEAREAAGDRLLAATGVGGRTRPVRFMGGDT